MRSTLLEYKFRFPIQVAIYLLGFWAPWERYGGQSFGGSTVWTAVPSLLFRQHWMGFSAAARLLLILATTLAVLAAAVRTWAASYGRPDRTDAAPTLRDRIVAANGPFRHIRNPLYWGTIFHVLALSLLMPPSGAAVAVLLLAGMQLRVIGYEERLARERQGQTYAEYARTLPRLWPSGGSRVPAAGESPNWWRGALSQIAYLATAAGFLVEGASYNGTLILRWVLVGVGLQLIWDAVMKTPPPHAAEDNSR